MIKIYYFRISHIIPLLEVFGAYLQEKKEFNNGICPHCGKRLVHFDDDSQGGQGWCCYDCKYCVDKLV